MKEEERQERVDKLAGTIRSILETYDFHDWIRLKRRCYKDEDVYMDAHCLAINLDEVLTGGKQNGNTRNSKTG